MISNIFKFLNLIVKFFFSWSAQVLSRELIAVISIYIYIYILNWQKKLSTPEIRWGVHKPERQKEKELLSGKYLVK